MSERRHRTLVNQFQRKLMFRIACYAAVYQFTLWNFMVFWRMLTTGEGGFFEQYGQYSREFAPMLLCMTALVPALIWDAAKFTHRVAGPLVQISGAVRRVAEGRPLSYVRFREQDELKELQDEFNDMLDSLSATGAVSLTNQTANQGTERSTIDVDDRAFAVEEEVVYVE